MINTTYMSWLCQISSLVLVLTNVKGATEEEAEKYLQDLEPKYDDICYQRVLSSWTSSINITDETRKAADDDEDKFTQFLADIQTEVNTRFSNWKTFQNKRIRKAFKFLAVGGPATMPMDRVQQMSKIQGDMQSAYGTATVCVYKDPTNCTLKISHLEGLMKTLTDPKEMEYYFTAWHDKMSEMVPPQKYKEFVDYLNEWASANGYPSESGLWLEPYDEETPGWSYKDFEKDVIALELEISPMYKILHAYIRMKLRKMPEFQGLIDKCGYMPAHIFGNMWAQTWTNLGAKTTPFPNAPTLDATESMKQQGYTPIKMFKMADQFFRDLGMNGMYPEFYNSSILERPKTGQQITCHATAWDFCKGKGSHDFRIRQCTRVDQEEFLTVHHEMGHIAYFQEYSELEFAFRSAANPGFQEAIGDCLALAVLTPGHLQCKLGLDLGLDKSFCQNQTGPFKVTETDLNYLFITSLDKLVFFPFGISVDTWRYYVFDGLVKPEEYNERWWAIRKYYQGIVPPGDRAKHSKLFDPAAKYHVVSNVDYLRYFIAGILQFQFYEAMCIASSQFNPKDPNTKPLYQCDFSGSQEAGSLLKSMLKMGSSHGWPDALEVMTGSRKMSVQPLKNYLQPILDYMENELKANGEVIGFGDSCEQVELKNKSLPMSIDDRWESLKSGKFFTEN